MEIVFFLVYVIFYYNSKIVFNFFKDLRIFREKEFILDFRFEILYYLGLRGK